MIVLALQIVLGIWVSANQAALVCNGFPTCNGQWWSKADYHNALNFLHGLFSGYTGVVAFDAQVAILWLHRIGALACIVVLILLMLSATSAVNPKPVRRAGLWLSMLLFIQIGLSVLGGKWGMSAWLIHAHLAGSVLLMLPLISIGFYSRYGYAETRQPVIQIEPEPEVVEIGGVPLPVAPQVEERYVEPPPASLLSRLKLQLKRTRSGLGGILASLPIGEKEINDDLLEEIEAALIMADVGIDTTNNIINRLTHQLERHQLRDGVALTAALKQELLNILKPCNKPLHIPEQDKPFVILVVGVNGAGKTTTIGKLAKRLQAQGHSVMLAAGDTFRAAAVEQLQVWGERNNIHVVAQHTGADSASVIFDGVQSALAKGVDVLIADTAGRLHTKSNLMDELKKVKRIMSKLDESAPHEVLLVLDAGTGQNALSQAKLFNETVNLTGLVLTKLDGTAKGGVIFALAKQTGIPIRFIGIGEGIDDLQDFDAENFVDALFVND
jgi:fused signal recognition particle receptor